MFFLLLKLFQLFWNQRCALEILDEDCLFMIMKQLDIWDFGNFERAYPRVKRFSWIGQLRMRKEIEDFKSYYL